MRSITATFAVMILVSTAAATSIHQLHKMQRFDKEKAPALHSSAPNNHLDSSSSTGSPLQCLGNLSAAWYTGIMGAHSWMEAATNDCVNKTKLHEHPHACQDEIVKGAARLTEAAGDIRNLATACNRSSTKCGQDLKEVGAAVHNIASDSLGIFFNCKKNMKTVKQLEDCLSPLFDLTSEAKSVKKTLQAAVQNCGQRDLSLVSNVEKEEKETASVNLRA